MPLTGGTASYDKVSPHSVAVSATDATGGTAPYTYQWQVNWPRAGNTYSSAVGAGVTTKTATVGKLGPAALYRIRLKYTDSAAASVTSNVLTVATLPRRWFAGLNRRELIPLEE
jgi:hypothetical protein